MSNDVASYNVKICEAAKILKVHENTVRNYIKKEWLTFWKMPNGQIRLNRSEVEALAQAERAWKKHHVK